MASFIIHIAVAVEINKILKRNNSSIMTGSIAPDMAKLIGENKIKTHFQDRNDNIPNLNKFLTKYRNNLNNDFVLGYYIHLYTDYLWFKDFEPNFYKNNIVKKLDNTYEEVNLDKKLQYFYQDYTSLNIELINKYKIDISNIDKNIQEDNIIKEINYQNIPLVINKLKETISTSVFKDPIVFNKDMVHEFIKEASNTILNNLTNTPISRI